MVLQTVAERLLEGRRMGFEDLHELLVAEPELGEAVRSSLAERYFTRRRLREGIGRLPELRVELGREPRVLDALTVLTVLAEVPELRELALEAVSGGGFSAAQLMRAARRHPELLEAVVDALLSEGESQEQVAELLERVPGSEAVIRGWAERAGVPVSVLVGGVEPEFDEQTVAVGSVGVAGDTVAQQGVAAAPAARAAPAANRREPGRRRRRGESGRRGREGWWESARTSEESSSRTGASSGGGVGAGELSSAAASVAGALGRRRELRLAEVASGGASAEVGAASGGASAEAGELDGLPGEGELDAMTWVRAAQANPELVERAVSAVLGDGPTTERVLALVNWLPGSEAAIADRLSGLGLPDGVVESLMESTPKLAEEAWRVTREEWAGTKPPSTD